MIFNYEIVKPLLYNSRNKNPIKVADNMINRSLFAMPPFGNVKLDIENGFKNDINSRRIWRLIHGHTFLGDLYIAYNKTNDCKYIKFAEKLLLLWFDRTEKDNTDRMIFHDETTALRVMYWLRFNYVAHDIISNDLKNKLESELDKTINLLMSDDFHSTNTNHGMFQDISLLTYAIMYNKNPLESPIYKLALKRLKEYFLSTFTNDGVHKEHSPDYHYMVTSYVKRIVEVLESLNGNDLGGDEQELSKIYNNAEQYSIHILQPNLYLPKIADCTPLLLSNNSTYFNLYDSEEFNYVKTSGESGIEPSQKQVLFEDAGYFISRSSWKKDATYFLFLASYKARYHKHSDDLSFVLFKEEDLFIDSGPNGYDYDSKYTKYAYSGFAHSSLIVNNTSLPRNDDQFDKVGILQYEFEDKGKNFKVTGFNKRYTNAIHVRTVKGNHETENYLIEDDIESEDNNEYKLLYKLSHKVYALIDGLVISIFDKKTNSKKGQIDLSTSSTVKNLDIQIVEGFEESNRSFEFLKMGEPIPSPTVIISFNNEGKKVKVSTNISLKTFTHGIIGDIDKRDSQTISHINYSLEESRQNFKRLIVVFKSINNYIDGYLSYSELLEDSNTYKLYINGESGYGDNDSRLNESAVVSLILNILSTYSIPFEKVTLLGIEEDAVYALHYGFKYGFNNIVSGSSQLILDESNGLYTEGENKEVDEITVDTTSLYLNYLIKNIKKSNKNLSNYYLCIPDQKYSKSEGRDFTYTKLSNYNNNLKSQMKDFIRNTINDIYNINFRDNKIQESEFFLSTSDFEFERTSNDDTTLNIKSTSLTINFVYHILEINNEMRFRSNPIHDNKIIFKNSEILNKRIKIFVRYENGIETFLTPVIRDLDKIIINKTGQ